MACAVFNFCNAFFQCLRNTAYLIAAFYGCGAADGPLNVNRSTER